MPKYLIKAKIVVEGIVEKPDVIGAVFGQTEGLLGDQLDLRQLQDKGRIGRILVDLKTQGTKSIGEITIPSNLDRVETALIAAMIETVDKVGPYPAKIEVTDIIDVRLEKIKKIVERAKEILLQWSRQRGPDLKEIINELEETLKPPEIIKYGPEQLPAGPGVEKSDTLIIVEGRADVLNLLRYGYTNVIALGGAKTRIPKSLVDLAKTKKKVIVFLDGDRAGDLILKELIRTDLKIDYIARAPPGREVEELTGSEIKESIKNAIPLKEYLEQAKKRTQQKTATPAIQKKAPAQQAREFEELISIDGSIVDTIKNIQGTLEAVFYSKDWKIIGKSPVRNIVDKLMAIKENNIHAIVFDGIITQRLLDAAKNRGIKIIIGAKLGNITYKPEEITILTFNDII